MLLHIKADNVHMAYDANGAQTPKYDANVATTYSFKKVKKTILTHIMKQICKENFQGWNVMAEWWDCVNRSLNPDH